VATEQDAARDRVLAARAELAEQLELLEASGRAAIDVPAQIRRRPGRAIAIVGGLGFLALKGPQRVMRGTRRTIFGAPKPMPKSLLPAEVDATLRSLGDDGEQVRGVLERDFASYAKAAQAERNSLRTILILSVARPVLLRASKSIAAFLFSPDERDLMTRLEQVRARASRGPGGVQGVDATGALDDVTATAGDAAGSNDAMASAKETPA
jgi:hypothetical protein